MARGEKEANETPQGWQPIAVVDPTMCVHHSGIEATLNGIEQKLKDGNDRMNRFERKLDGIMFLVITLLFGVAVQLAFMIVEEKHEAKVVVSPKMLDLPHDLQASEE